MTDLNRKRKRALFRVILHGESRDMQYSRLSKKKRGSLNKGATYLLLLISFLAFSALLAYQALSMARMGVPLEMIYGTCINLMIILNVLFGIFSVANYLYYPKDLPFYLSLPYTAKEVMFAKFLHFFTLSFLGTLLFVPYIAAALFTLGAPPIFYVTGILGILLCGMAVDLFMTILTIVIMRFSSFARDKDRFTTLTSVLLIFISMGVAVGMQFIGHGGSTAATLGKLSSLSTPWQLLFSVICPPRMLAPFVFSTKLSYALLTIPLSLILLGLYFWLMLFLGDKFYFKGVMAIQGAGGRRSDKVFNEGELRKILKPSTSMSRAFAEQQIKKVRRNPTFFTQIFLTPILMPLMFIAVFGVVGYLGLREEGSQFKEVFKMVQGFFSGISFESSVFLYLVMGVAIFVAFNTMSNALTFRVLVSTEGEDLFYFKQLPQGMGCYLLGLQKAFLPLGLLPHLALLAFLMLVLGLPLPLMFFALLNAGILSYSLAMVYLIYGTFRPTLDWDSEIQLVKGNPKLALVIYSGVLSGAILAAPQVLLLYFNNRFSWLGNGVVLLFTLAFNILIALALTKVYYGPAKRALERIEP